MRFVAVAGVGLLICCATRARNIDATKQYTVSSPDPNERCIAVLFRGDDSCTGTASSSLDGKGDAVNALCPRTARACDAVIDCHCGLIDAGPRRVNLYVFSDCGDRGDAGLFAHDVMTTTEVDAGVFNVCQHREAYELGDWPDE